MIKSNQFLFILLFLLTAHTANAQVSPQKSTTLNVITQQQFDSLYHALMTEKYPEYADWKKGLPKRKRKVFIKNSVIGFFAGALVGTSLSMTGATFCQTIEEITAPLIEPEPHACKPKIKKAILITGSLGLIIGITASEIENKKISKFSPTILY